MIFSVSMTKTFIFVPCGASVLTNISNFKITSNRYRNRTECNKCTKTDLFTVVITCPDTGVFLKFFCTILMEFVVALFSRLLIESIIKENCIVQCYSASMQYLDIQKVHAEVSF